MIQPDARDGPRRVKADSGGFYHPHWLRTGKFLRTGLGPNWIKPYLTGFIKKWKGRAARASGETPDWKVRGTGRQECLPYLPCPNFFKSLMEHSKFDRF